MKEQFTIPKSKTIKKNRSKSYGGLSEKDLVYYNIFF